MNKIALLVLVLSITFVSLVAVSAAGIFYFQPQEINVQKCRSCNDISYHSFSPRHDMPEVVHIQTPPIEKCSSCIHISTFSPARKAEIRYIQMPPIDCQPGCPCTTTSRLDFIY